MAGVSANFDFPFPGDRDMPTPASLKALADAADAALTSMLSVWQTLAQVNQIIPSGTATGLYMAGAVKRASTSAQSDTVPTPAPVPVPADIAAADMAGISGHQLRKSAENVIAGFKPVYKFGGTWERPDSTALSGLTRVRIVVLKPPHDNYAGMLQTGLLIEPATNSHGLPVELVSSSGVWDPVADNADDDFYPFGFEVSGAATNARVGFNMALQRHYVAT